MKRIFDLLVSITALLIMSPIFLLLAILVRVNIGAPIFFIQERPGLYGKTFNLIKFRTMSEEKSADGTLLPDKERLTHFGQLLRATSLDELPELWNVLKGEMSLVGPRPLLLEYLPLYSTEQFSRHDVPPGITGWAQVNGRNALSWEQKLKYDIWYVKNRSFCLDIKILWITIEKVITGEGITADGEVTTTKFTGKKE